MMTYKRVIMELWEEDCCPGDIDASTMTAAELRELLAEFPADAPVLIRKNPVMTKAPRNSTAYSAVTDLNVYTETVEVI